MVFGFTLYIKYIRSLAQWIRAFGYEPKGRQFESVKSVQVGDKCYGSTAGSNPASQGSTP